PGAPTSFFWSSTALFGVANNAWAVDFGFGSVLALGTGGARSSARCVGAGLGSTAGAATPISRYSFPATGVVLDNKTTLTWQQTPPMSTFTLSGALSYCAGLNLGGTGWRLPTAKELLTLVDYSRSGTQTTGMIDPTA